MTELYHYHKHFIDFFFSHNDNKPVTPSSHVLFAIWFGFAINVENKISYSKVKILSSWN